MTRLALALATILAAGPALAQKLPAAPSPGEAGEAPPPPSTPAKAADPNTKITLTLGELQALMASQAAAGQAALAACKAESALADVARQVGH